MSKSTRKLLSELLEGTEAGTAPRRPVLFISDDAWSPPTDIVESPNAIYVVVELAGMAPSDVDIRYDQGYLILEGEREEVTGFIPEKIIRFHKKEIDAGHFRVRVKINSRIVRENIEASYHEGYLVIQLPKDERQKSSRSVKVPVSE